MPLLIDLLSFEGWYDIVSTKDSRPQHPWAGPYIDQRVAIVHACSLAMTPCACIALNVMCIHAAMTAHIVHGNELANLRVVLSRLNWVHHFIEGARRI